MKVRDIALGSDSWPDPIRQIGNSFHNQLEMPVLFYVLVAFAMMTKKADLIFVVMSWIFVVARYAHAFVHTTSNRVATRFNLFFVGTVVLILMWIIFAFRIVANS